MAINPSARRKRPFLAGIAGLAAVIGQAGAASAQDAAPAGTYTEVFSFTASSI